MIYWLTDAYKHYTKCTCSQTEKQDKHKNIKWHANDNKTSS